MASSLFAGKENDSTSQSRSDFFEEAKSQAKIPFIHYQLLQCDSSGQKLHIEDMV